jgi:predicted permease
MQFSTVAFSVLIMLLYGVPGYIFVKIKMINPKSISAFALILLYVCQPCLSIYSFNKADFSPDMLKDMGIFIAICLAVQVLGLLLGYLIFRKKYDDIKYRIMTVAMIFGNIGFMGVPLLENLLPNYPNAVLFSAIYIVIMNLVSWTVGLFIITGDKSYISIKKLVLNPPFLTLFITLPLFFTGTKLPVIIENSVTVLGKMTTPMCMLILGMRLATMSFKEIFGEKEIYITSAVKLIIFPLVAFGLIYFLPIENYIKATMLILTACPTASVVLNLAEIEKKGQNYAANNVLACTILSAITIPLVLLIL